MEIIKKEVPSNPPKLTFSLIIVIVVIVPVRNVIRIINIGKILLPKNCSILLDMKIKVNKNNTNPSIELVKKENVKIRHNSILEKKLSVCIANFSNNKPSAAIFIALVSPYRKIKNNENVNFFFKIFRFYYK